jgi:hypothetical protein
MKNLEKSVGMHRRLVGLKKSKVSDDFGTFDLNMKHSRIFGSRKLVCTVRKGLGWEMLDAICKEKGAKGWQVRYLYPAEIQKLVALFFEPWERPVQFHSTSDRDASITELWLPPLDIDLARRLPDIGPTFSLG